MSILTVLKMFSLEEFLPNLLLILSGILQTLELLGDNASKKKKKK